MPPPFRHLVLTRLNIQTPFAPSAQRLDDEWIRARLEPMRRFCIPSVASQTREVTWLVFVDEESPRWLKDEIAAHPVIRPIWFSGPGTFEAMGAAVRDTGLVDRPYLITTRVDSDDALASTFAATVQSAFAEQERQFVELPVGHQRFRGGLYTRVWRSNPFISLVERVEEAAPVTTVFCMSHAQVLRSQPTTTLWRSPQWLQTLHATNNESVLAGGAVPHVRSRPARFACDWDETEDPFRRRARLAWDTGTHRLVRKTRAVLGRQSGS